MRRFINVCSETLDTFNRQSSVLLWLIFDSNKKIKLRSQCVAHKVRRSLFFRSSIILLASIIIWRVAMKVRPELHVDPSGKCILTFD